MSKPILVKNFISNDEQKLLSTMGKIFLRSNKHHFDHQNGAAIATYSMTVTEALLVNKLKLMREKTGKKLVPSNSFSRIYTKYCFLGKHTDRPTCEYSVTVFIDSCRTYEWPLYIDGVPYHLEPGDAIIYEGCNYEHWREEFLGDWHFQCFLHYVDEEGPYSDHVYDKRKTLGDSKW
tara:strand:+ start:2463 stop:2993 length:531 start_codon:yes stop_codon:yes gene_type:complete